VDYEKFGAERSVDFKVMMDAFVSLEIDFASNLESTWSSILPTLDNFEKKNLF
jgi:hypothetical protein